MKTTADGRLLGKRRHSSACGLSTGASAPSTTLLYVDATSQAYGQQCLQARRMYGGTTYSNLVHHAPQHRNTSKTHARVRLHPRQTSPAPATAAPSRQPNFQGGCGRRLNCSRPGRTYRDTRGKSAMTASELELARRQESPLASHLLQRLNMAQHPLRGALCLPNRPL